MGADGHHFAVLTGPGRIWLQSMPIPLVGRRHRRVHAGPRAAIRSRRERRPAGTAKVLGDLFPVGEPWAYVRLMAFGGTVSGTALP